ncbi:uncharacterized protein V1516DRAFT_685982 [Lipomyces oligophaga]|uniref:uncharacterized protein n=1 Tax=Lipomyces oligophaga TaxID=45792 RepID=UPI0034CF9649
MSSAAQAAAAATAGIVAIKNAAGKFQCQECTRSYLHAKHLKRHLLRHTGDRPYKCSVCADSFCRSDILKRHYEKCQSRHASNPGAAALSSVRPRSSPGSASSSSSSSSSIPARRTSSVSSTSSLTSLSGLPSTSVPQPLNITSAPVYIPSVSSADLAHNGSLLSTPPTPSTPLSPLYSSLNTGSFGNQTLLAFSQLHPQSQQNLQLSQHHPHFQLHQQVPLKPQPISIQLASTAVSNSYSDPTVAISTIHDPSPLFQHDDVDSAIVYPDMALMSSGPISYFPPPTPSFGLHPYPLIHPDSAHDWLSTDSSDSTSSLEPPISPSSNSNGNHARSATGTPQMSTASMPSAVTSTGTVATTTISPHDLSDYPAATSNLFSYLRQQPLQSQSIHQHNSSHAHQLVDWGYDEDQWTQSTSMYNVSPAYSEFHPNR